MLPLTTAHQFPARQKIFIRQALSFFRTNSVEGPLRKNSLLGHPLLASFALAALVWLLLAGVVWSGLLDSAELEGYDLLIYRRGYPELPANLAIVDFDEATIAALACYPVPRQSVDDVLEKVEAGQPSYVGFDVWLTERRCGDPDNGRLALDLTRAHNVILTDSFPAQDRVDDNIPAELRDHALEVAFGDVPVDTDGKIRRMFLGHKKQGAMEASFSAAVASYYTGESFHTCGPQMLCLGKNQIPLDGPRRDTFLIGYWAASPSNEISAISVLRPGFDPSIFKGKIVLVGQSNSKSGDLYTTPEFRFHDLGKGRAMLSGVEIQAAAIETLLGGPTIRLLGRVPQWSFNFLLIWLVVALLITVRPAFGIPAVLIGVFGAYLLAQSMYSEHHLWLRFVAMEAGMVLATPVAVGYRFLDERRLKAEAEAEQREVMSLFERYVSPDVAAEIWRRRGEIVLAGQERTATVLFSDIRNFTTLTTGRSSTEVLAWLNNYLTAMSEIVDANRGFLNKFIGDGIMIIFGVPLSEGTEQDACRAARTASQMVRRVEELNAQRKPEWPELKIGIGIHTGRLTAGNVGASNRLEYSVIGETVNLASRLESLTKDFRTSIVVSPITEQFVRSQFETVELGESVVRGFDGEIPFYTLKNERRAGADS
jgi:adenylate cyclase